MSDTGNFRSDAVEKREEGRNVQNWIAESTPQSGAIASNLGAQQNKTRIVSDFADFVLPVSRGMNER